VCGRLDDEVGVHALGEVGRAGVGVLGRRLGALRLGPRGRDLRRVGADGDRAEEHVAAGLGQGAVADGRGLLAAVRSGQQDRRGRAGEQPHQLLLGERDELLGRAGLALGELEGDQLVELLGRGVLDLEPAVGRDRLGQTLVARRRPARR
jgi:hypothetical protein